MIEINFIINREVFKITVKGKEVYYKDKRWGEKKLLPITVEQERNLKKIGMDSVFDDEAGKEMYEKAETEEELAEIIIKDCKQKGAILLRKNAVNI